MIKKRTFIIILCMIIFASCSRNKSETIILVKDNKYMAAGKTNIRISQGGGVKVDPFIPGALVIFKNNSQVLNQQGYAGEVYKIDKDLVLSKIANIDTSLADSLIIEKFLIE